MTSQTMHTDVAIIGAGPAGLFAAFECCMLKIKCLLVDALSEVGGQCTALYPEKSVYDIPAHPMIVAQDLISALEKQIAPFDIPLHLGKQVISLTGHAGRFVLETSNGDEIFSKAIIIAAGAGAFGPNRPPLERLSEFEKTGCVQYYIRDRQSFAGQTIVIAGGGDSAVDWALSLQELAKKIYLVHRRNRFKAAPESLSKLEKIIATGQIEKITPYQLHNLEGENGYLQGVEVITLDGQTRTLNAERLLPFFGLSTDLGPIHLWPLKSLRTTIPVECATMETSLRGVYAIGDIASYQGKLKLILQGFSEAAMAAHSLYPLVYPDTALHFEYSTTKGIPDH